MKPGYWRTRKGSVLKISEMSTTHLKNCVALCNRSMAAVQEAMDSIPWNHEDAMSSYYAGREQREATEDMGRLASKKAELEEELRRRA